MSPLGIRADNRIGGDGAPVDRPGWSICRDVRHGRRATSSTLPALTVPQVRMGLALILHRASRCDAPARVARERTRRLERNESARFYHYKARKQLTSLKISPHEGPRQ